MLPLRAVRLERESVRRFASKGALDCQVSCYVLDILKCIDEIPPPRGEG